MNTAYVKEIQTFLKQHVSAEDLIMALFSKLENDHIPKNHSVIHKAIYELKKNPEYEPFFKEFSFDVSGLIPYSRLLEEILNELETFCLLGTINPKYDTYFLNKKHLSKGYEVFPKTKKKIIDKMCKEFEAIIC
ncbi:MAG: hypothetical protein QHH10_07860 [Peptococcaceae bacterium]|nr:hypothetical protein [Peptococcaceae bacterium]MDH7525215.1 hypothetical protein [Peptococcaceae bacterium]